MGTRASATTLKPEMTDKELSALASWIPDADLKGGRLEIGTAAGGTLCFMMKLYPDEARPRFSVVDTMAYFPDQEGIVKRNLADNGLNADEVDFRIRSSDAAFAEAEAAGDRFDFILVDASHKIRYVMDDLRGKSEVTAVDRLWARLCSPILQWDLSLQKRRARKAGKDS